MPLGRRVGVTIREQRVTILAVLAVEIGGRLLVGLALHALTTQVLEPESRVRGGDMRSGGGGRERRVRTVQQKVDAARLGARRASVESTRTRARTVRCRLDAGHA